MSTGPQYQVNYTVTVDGATDGAGNAVDDTANRATFTGTRAIDGERPRVTTADSTGHTKVVVQFSKAMADNAFDPSRYSIVQENVNPEVGGVGVTAAQFARPDRCCMEGRSCILASERATSCASCARCPTTCLTR